MEDRIPPHDDADDGEIELLFTAVGEDLAGAIADCIELAERRSAVEQRLVALLEAAVDGGADFPSGTVWVALVLGEIQSRGAIPALLRALSGGDEDLCEAAIDAIKRIGEVAFDAVMEAMEGAEDAEFEHAAYQALEGVATWEHPYMLAEVRDFILERIKAPAIAARRLEDGALALARLGDLRALPVLKKALKSRFRGSNAAIQDAIEMLEENSSGVPVVPGAIPWQERVDWITRDAFASGED